MVVLEAARLGLVLGLVLLIEAQTGTGVGDANCTDRTLSTGVPWHDRAGSKYNCTWFAGTSASSACGVGHPKTCCEKYGDDGIGHSFGPLSANEACCACRQTSGSRSTHAQNCKHTDPLPFSAPIQGTDACAHATCLTHAATLPDNPINRVCAAAGTQPFVC